MGKGSGIAWTDHTFNPWWGCVKVSPACDNCYAATFDHRLGGNHWGKDAERRMFGDKHWNEPLKWNREAAKTGRRALVFCASMADVFESWRDDIEAPRRRLWQLIEETPALTWLLLTKRPQNIARMAPDRIRGAANVWLGTTLESPEFLWRAEVLLTNGAGGAGGNGAVRFVSMEPLVAQVSMRAAIASGINWVITGCESGAGARHTPTDWYRSLRDDAAAFGVPFFLKQASRGAEGITSGEGSWLKLKDGIVEQPYLDGVQHIGWPASGRSHVGSLPAADGKEGERG